MKFPNRKAKTNERGATAVQMLVILVPVLFGLIGFAVDLGILYSVKGELKAAADAMALAAAQSLMGTDASTTQALNAAQLTIENADGFGNKYYFHGLAIGQSSGSLTSTVSDPQFYATAADAVTIGSGGAGEVSGPLARHLRVTVTGQAQLLFWSFLPIVTDRNATVLASSVAGMSAPLCQACGVEPFAVAAVDQSETIDYGFIPGTKYSLAYLCNGAPTPPALAGAGRSIPYALLNRQDLNAVLFADDSTQTFRAGAAGLPGSTNSALACFRVNTAETIWPTAAVNLCNVNRVAPVVTTALCGLNTRFTSETALACSGIPGIDTLAASYQPDPDINDYDTYSDYTGNGRRIITVPIVDTVSGTGAMTVLGFRQFLLIAVNPSDTLGRFLAMYIGSVMPLKQGRFDGCQQAAGPGKVVLHQ